MGRASDASTIAQQSGVYSDKRDTENEEGPEKKGTPTYVYSTSTINKAVIKQRQGTNMPRDGGWLFLCCYRQYSSSGRSWFRSPERTTLTLNIRKFYMPIVDTKVPYILGQSGIH